MKIITVVGARPQFIKAAVVSRVMRERQNLHEIIVHTGQHYDANMSDVFFDELEIPKPDYNLGIGGGTHGQNTGRMLEAIESVLMKEKPDKMLVYGDTDSTLAASLAAVKLKIPVAHVEAGLRSFNKSMPEEINRILTDHASDMLFTPTLTAVKNLENEGVAKSKILHVGDVMYDAAVYYKSRLKKPHTFDSQRIMGDFILCTIHRAENSDNPSSMINIFNGLAQAGKTILIPLHPRTKDRLKNMDFKIPDNVKFIDPVGYLEMIWLELNCEMIATDSGGIQKEAYFHGKPCVTLRNETEWTELISAGVNELVGTDSAKIASALNKKWVSFSSINQNLYGNANAGELIAKSIMVNNIYDEE